MNFLTYGKLVAAQLTPETSTNHFFRRENENKGFTHISYQPDIPYTRKNQFISFPSQTLDSALTVMTKSLLQVSISQPGDQSKSLNPSPILHNSLPTRTAGSALIIVSCRMPLTVRALAFQYLDSLLSLRK